MFALLLVLLVVGVLLVFFSIFPEDNAASIAMLVVGMALAFTSIVFMVVGSADHARAQCHAKGGHVVDIGHDSICLGPDNTFIGRG